MKRLCFSLFFLCFAYFLSGQNQPLSFIEKKEGNKISIYAKNSGNETLDVQYDIEKNGLTIDKETPFTFQIGANKEVLLFHMQSSPGTSWSYKHKVAYRPLKKEIVVEQRESPIDPTLAKVEANNKRDKEIEALQKNPTFKEQTVSSGKPALEKAVTVKDLVIYSKENCGRCNYVIKSLKNKSIAYKELDIEKNEKSRQAMWTLLQNSGFEGQRITTPVIVLNDQLYYNIEDLVDFTEKLKK